jgi:hypothetical protein
MEYADHLRSRGRQLDAERILESFLVTADEIDEIFATHTYIGTKNLELAEQHHERAKVIWGARHPLVMVNEYLLARNRGDDALADSIEDELLQRMESEYVNYIFGDATSLKRRFQLAYQQRQPHFLQSILRSKPSYFTDEEWRDLRKKMNINELGDSALRSPTSRTKEEVNALLERRIELDQSVIDNYIGVYKIDPGLYTVKVFRKGTELWYEARINGWQDKMIAVAENQFELLNDKLRQIRFLERSPREYDLELTFGQVVSLWRHIDNEIGD